jgi:hypothetical protein
MPINIFNTFGDPLASIGTTQAFGVNGMDQIVGYYQNTSGVHGFLESGGIYTTLDDPSANPQGTLHTASTARARSSGTITIT